MKILAWLFLCLPLLSLAVSQEDHARLAADVWGTPQTLALTIQHEEKWHTYWKNPGDAGIATVFKFELDGKEIKLEEHEWPAPHRYLESGDILTYGYEGSPTFFFKLPADIKGQLKAKAQWLICKEICIPGGKEAELLFAPNAAPVVKTHRSGLSDSALTQKLQALPQGAPWPSDLDLYISKTGEKTLRLDYSIKGYQASQWDIHRNLLTPFLAPPVGYKRELVRFDAKEQALTGMFTLEWDGEYQEPPQPLSADGRFAPPVKMKFLYQSPDGRTLVIEKEFTSFSPTAAGLQEQFEKLQPLSGDASPKTSAATEQPSQNLALMLLLAFVGGLILNLMPCVLPVISIKLFGLIKYQTLPKARILKHNLVYSAGVIATFLVLALSVVLIKKSGEAVGWGFQLQSPLFVLVMIGVLFVMTLNLFGLFEFVTPGGRVLGNKQTQDGFMGDFFSGVLSTILSTPCSAPFLGTALAFAFTGSTAMIMLVFSFVGLGLASPFLLTGIFPGLITFLPRPGGWMEKLKYFLGLTMLVTVAWLSDVFLNLVDPQLWMWPLALFFISLFFAFFFRAKISKNPGLNLLFFLLPLALVLSALKTFPMKPADRMEAPLSSSIWQPWSPEMLVTHKGQWIFMDFTAAWCLTCKVNKKLVLDTQEFQNFMADKNVVLLRGDWTQRDDTITNFLKSYNIVGVPAYFIQKPDGTMLSLGETISLGKVQEHIK